MRIRGFEQGDKFAVMRFELFRVEFLRRYVGVVDADAENGKIRPDKFQVFGQMAATQPGRYVGPVNPYGMIDQSVPVVFRKDACQRETSALSGVDAYVRCVAGFGVVYQETVRGSVMLREEGVSAMYGVGICRGVVGIAQYAQSCEMPGGRIARIEPERQAGGRVAGADCGSGQSEGISAVGLDAPATFPCPGRSLPNRPRWKSSSATGGSGIRPVHGCPRCGGCLFCLCRWIASYPFCDRVCRSRPVRMGIATCCLPIG